MDKVSVTQLRVAPRALVKSLLALCLVWSPALHADDDNTPLPPVNPGPGYEGIFSNPPLPPGYVIDQSTRPYGVGSVYNAPQLVMGQSFRPARSEIDWMAFVFQNSTQPGPDYPAQPGPGLLQLSLYSALNQSTGALGGLLGVTNMVAIASNTTQWLTFQFPQSIAVTPGVEYFVWVQNVAGSYPTWVGGQTDTYIYSAGRAWGYLLNEFNGEYQRITSFDNDDLVFAEGVLAAVPEPASVVTMVAGLTLVGLAVARHRGRPARRPEPGKHGISS